MKFAIQINSAPWENQGCETAYQFSRAASHMGHEILLIFFYHAGAYNGLRWMMPPEEESPLLKRWSILAAKEGIDLAICISAAHRRGLLEQTEARRVGKLDDDLAPGFRIAGLGLWVDACLKADRFLIFGA